MLPSDYEERVRRKAGELFRRDELNCAEAAFKALLVEAGTPCPVEVLCVASPFGRGMGGAGCCCGALIGAQLALGRLHGRRKDHGAVPRDCCDLARQLHDGFAALNRATCCRVLHKGHPFGSPEQLESCAQRTEAAAAMAAAVLLKASMP